MCRSRPISQFREELQNLVQNVIKLHFLLTVTKYRYFLTKLGNKTQTMNLFI